MKLLGFITVMFYSLICKVQSNSSSIEKQIKDYILNGYDKFLRPVKNLTDVVTVRLNPGLYSLININAAQQEITLKYWYRMYWTDQFLTWNPEEYGGVRQIKISRSEVWLPDIMMLSMTDRTQLSNEEFVVKINSDGSMRSSIDQLVTVYCPFEVGSFPYDTQNCEISYSSWSFNANEIDLNVTIPTDLEMYTENNEWTLKNYSAYRSLYTSDGGTFVNANYNIKITRKPSYYVNTFMWPSFIITCLSIVGVFSPFNEAGEREEKVTLGLTTLLTMAVVLMIVTDQMPKSSNGMPLLGVFIVAQIAIAAIATLVATALIHLHSSWMKKKRVPRFLLAILWMPRTKIAPNINPSTVHKFSEDERENLRQEWSIATKRLDFLFLVTFVILNSAVFVIILIIGNAQLNK